MIVGVIYLIGLTRRSCYWVRGLFIYLKRCKKKKSIIMRDTLTDDTITSLLSRTEVGGNEAVAFFTSDCLI